MYAQRNYRGVAAGHAAGIAVQRIDSPVRLRMSPTEWVLVAIRWVLGVAVGVVVLWAGGAFLATPASAAAVPAQAIVAGAAKGGKERSSGSDNSDSKKSGKSESKESKSDDSDSDSDSDDKPSKSKDDSGKKADKKSVAKKDDSDSDSDSDDKRSTKKDRDRASDAIKDVVSKARSALSKNDDARDEDDERGDVRARAAKGGRDRDRASDSSDSEDRDGDDHNAAAASGDKLSAVVQQAVEQHAKGKDKVEGIRKETRDRVAAARADAGRKIEGASKTVRAALAQLRDRDGRDDADRAGDGKRGREFKQGLVASTIKHARAAVDKALDRHDDNDGAAALQRLVSRLLAEHAKRSGAAKDEDPRAPPSKNTITRGAAALAAEKKQVEAGKLDKATYAKHVKAQQALATKADADGADKDPEESMANQVLSGRLSVARGEQSLAAAKKQVAAGKLSKAAYAKQVKSQQALVTKVNGLSKKLSPERAELVDEVVNGHVQLTRSQAALAAEQKLVAAGKASSTTYKEHQAQYERMRKQVFAATGDLAEVTGHDTTVSLGKGGQAAGCTSSGSYAQCVAGGGGSKGSADGDRRSCMALAGISSCGVSTGSGADRASASCAMVGKTGCGADARKGTGSNRTSIWSGCGIGSCQIVSRVTADGAATTCQSANGCRGNGAAPVPTSAKDLVGGAVSCPGRCETTLSVGASGTIAGCHASTGRCDAHNTGNRAGIQGVRGEAQAHCGGGASGCSTDAQLGLGSGSDPTNAAGQVACRGDRGCKGAGSANTAVDLRVSGPGSMVTRRTTGGANCSVTAGDCSARASSIVERPAAGSPSGSSQAASEVTCTDVAGCGGRGTSATMSTGAGDMVANRAVAAKTSTGSSGCATSGGACTSTSDSSTRMSDTQAVLSSVSNASGSLDCPAGSASCGGTVTSAATGSDAAFNRGVSRGASGAGSCQVTAGGCRATTESKASSGPEMTLPGQSPAAAGPSAVSEASASVDCSAGAQNCSGTATSSATSFDPAFGAARTSTGRAACTAGGGACAPQTRSVASTGPGAAQALAGDGALPVGALTTGPSAASAAGASLTCEAICTGSVTSAASGLNPSVSLAARGSSGTGSCGGATGCRAVTNSGGSAGSDASTIAPIVREASTADATTTSTGDGGAPGDRTDQPTNQTPATLPGGSPGAGANVAPTVPGASSWSSASATLDCSGGPDGCTGTVRSSATGNDGPHAANGTVGARGPPPGAGGARTSATCNGQDGCQAQTNSTAGTGQVVADTIAVNQKAAVEPAAQAAQQAQQAADEAAKAAAAPGATAAQKKAATEAAAAAKQAADTARQAAEAVGKPITNAPATMSQSSAAGQCASSGCTATTTGDTSTTAGTVGGRPATSHTAATCTAAASGCGVGSSAEGSTATNSGVTAGKNGKPLPGSSGQAQTSSQLACPDAGCSGSLTGSAFAPGGKRSGTSVATIGCTATEGGCEAQVTAATSTMTAPAVKASAASAQVAASCESAGGSCRTSATATAPGNVGTATCAGVTCEADATVGIDNGIPQVTAGCAGATGCAATSHGSARAAGQSASFSATCTAGAGQRCDTGGQAAVDRGSAVATAACSGPRCGSSVETRSRAGGAVAEAKARCSAGAGVGSCRATASTQAGQGSAAASASCTGSAGVKCSYSFRASASASASFGANWASAHASGSGRGTVGGGGVMVSAHAEAGPNSASASATCAGTRNCSSTFTAHAEAHDSLDVPPTLTEEGRLWSADGSGTCSGSNGGCGVTAWANAGPGGSGGASCSGDCSNFVQEAGGPSTYVVTSPPLGAKGGSGAPMGPDGKPIPLEKLGPNWHGATVQRDEQGRVVITLKPLNGRAKSFVCPSAPCAGSLPTGEEGRWDGKTFSGTNPRVKGKPSDTGSGSQGVGLAGDARGNGSGWVGGNGSVYDGYSGTRVQYRNGKPIHTASFMNPRGAPFTTRCDGSCVYDSQGVHLAINGVGTIQGRDGHGNAARFWFEGNGKYSTPQGDRLNLTQGAAFIVGRNGAGFGGSMTIQGVRGITGVGTITGTGGISLSCSHCDNATRYLPTSAGRRGINTCEVSAPGSSCTGIDVWKGKKDVQYIGVPLTRLSQQPQLLDPDPPTQRRPAASTYAPGSAGFVQFLRDSDGSGGGAVAFTSGVGVARGSDAYRNWVHASGDGGGMLLLYAEDDGYNRGQSCVAGKGGTCSGSDSVARRLPWLNVTKAETSAFGLYGNTPIRLPKGTSGPLTMDGSTSLLDRGRVALAFGMGKAHFRWRAETGNRQYAPLLAAIDRAAQNGLTPRELAALAQQYNRLDSRLKERMARTEGALDAILKATGNVRTSIDDIEQRLAADPKLAAALGRTLPRGTTLAGQQAISRALEAKLAASRPGSAQEAQLRRELQASQGILRMVDVAAAVSGGDPAYAQNIAFALQSVNTINRFVNALPKPRNNAEVAAANTLLKFGNDVHFGYFATIEAPRSPSNRLHDLHLPSTGSPDLTLAQTAASRMPTYRKQLSGIGRYVWDHMMTPDERAALAANVSAKQAFDSQAKLEAAVTGVPSSANQFDMARRNQLFRTWLKSELLSDPGLASQFKGSVLDPTANRRLNAQIADAAPSGVEIAGDFIGRALKVGTMLVAESGNSIDAKELQAWGVTARDLKVFGMTPADLGAGTPPSGWSSWASRNSANVPDSHLGPVLAGAGQAIGHMTGATLQELSFIATSPATRAQMPAESWAEYYAHYRPFTGMFVVSGQNLWNRWKPVITEGDWSKVAHGSWRDGLIGGYADDPLLTALDDLTVPTLVLGGAGSVFKLAGRAFAGASLKAGDLAATATGDAATAGIARAAQLARWSKGLTATGRILGIPLQVVTAPYRLFGLAGRGIVGLGADAAAWTSGKARTGATLATVQMRRANGSVWPRVWKNLSTGLRAAAPALEKGAWAGRKFADLGIFGLARTISAYRTLGVSRDTTLADLNSMHADLAAGPGVGRLRRAALEEKYHTVLADNIAARAARVLSGHTGEVASLKELAAELGISERALRNRLAREPNFTCIESCGNWIVEKQAGDPASWRYPQSRTATGGTSASNVQVVVVNWKKTTDHDPPTQPGSAQDGSGLAGGPLPRPGGGDPAPPGAAGADRSAPKGAEGSGERPDPASSRAKTEPSDVSSRGPPQEGQPPHTDTSAGDAADGSANTARVTVVRVGDGTESASADPTGYGSSRSLLPSKAAPAARPERPAEPTAEPIAEPARTPLRTRLVGIAHWLGTRLAGFGLLLAVAFPAAPHAEPGIPSRPAAVKVQAVGHAPDTAPRPVTKGSSTAGDGMPTSTVGHSEASPRGESPWEVPTRPHNPLSSTGDVVPFVWDPRIEEDPQTSGLRTWLLAAAARKERGRIARMDAQLRAEEQEALRLADELLTAAHELADTRTQPAPGTYVHAAEDVQQLRAHADKLRKEAERLLWVAKMKRAAINNLQRRAALPPPRKAPGRNPSVSWRKQLDQTRQELADMLARADEANRRADEIDRLLALSEVARQRAWDIRQARARTRAAVEGAERNTYPAYIRAVLEALAPLARFPQIPQHVMRDLITEAREGRVTRSDVERLLGLAGQPDEKAVQMLAEFASRRSMRWTADELRGLVDAIRAHDAARLPWFGLLGEHVGPGSTGDVSGGRSGPLGDLHDAEIPLVRALLTFVHEHMPWALRQLGSPNIRGPPPVSGHEQFVLDEHTLAVILGFAGLRSAQAQSIAARLIAFSFIAPATGAGVMVLLSGKLARLEELGLLGDVVAHEESHLDGTFDHGSSVAHDADRDRILDRLGLTDLAAVVESRVAEHLRNYFAKNGSQATFEADSDWLQAQSWFNAAVGDVVEDLGVGVLEPSLGEGEVLLRNVTVKSVKPGGGGQIWEIDFLVVDEGGVVRLISAKGSPGQFKWRHDRRMVLDLLRDIPLDVHELRDWLAKKTEEGPTALAATSGVEVTWHGLDQPMSLAEFRRSVAKDTVPNPIPIESIVPAGPKAKDHTVAVTRERVARKLVASALELMETKSDWLRTGRHHGIAALLLLAAIAHVNPALLVVAAIAIAAVWLVRALLRKRSATPPAYLRMLFGDRARDALLPGNGGPGHRGTGGDAVHRRADLLVLLRQGLGALTKALPARVFRWGAPTRGPPPGGPSRRGGGDLSGRQASKLARWLAKQFRRGQAYVQSVPVRNEHGLVVGRLRLLPVRGMAAWVLRRLKVDDLVAFAWVSSGERLVAVDAELFAQITRVQEVIAAARERNYHGLADELQRMLDGWLYDLFRHENVHFDHPDARHADHVFDEHRDVRHHLLDQAVAFAEFADRKMAAPALTKMWNTKRTDEVQQLLDRLAEIHRELPTVPVRRWSTLLAEAEDLLGDLDQLLGTGTPATDQQGWARLPDVGLGDGEVAKWDVWRLLSAVWLHDPALRDAFRSRYGLSAKDVVELIRRLAAGQPIDAPDWAAGLIRQMVARGLHEDAAVSKIAAWLAEFAELGLLEKHTALFGVERFRPGGVFGQMLARAPPEALVALWRNPLGVVGVGGLPTGMQAAAIREWLRGVVLTWGDVERGPWLLVPLRLRAWGFARDVRWAIKGARLAIIDLVNASEELAAAEKAGVVAAELAELAKARDEAAENLARIVGGIRDAAAARGVHVRRVREVGRQPRLLVDYQRRVYLPVIQMLFALAAVQIVHPLLAAVLSLIVFFPYWRPRPAGSYDRTAFWKRLTSFPRRVYETRWERGGAIAYTFPFWKLAIPIPLVGLAALAGAHPAAAWLALVLSVLALEVSASGEMLVGRIPDHLMRTLTGLDAADRSVAAGPLPVGRVSVSLVIFGLLRISIFVQHFQAGGTWFQPVPGVVPPRIVGFHPWLRLKARWMTYDKGFWSRTFLVFTFFQGGWGFGIAGGALIEPRRSLRKLIFRSDRKRRRTVDMLTGLNGAIGRFLFRVLRGIARLLPDRVRQRFVDLAEWRARMADRQQAQHARAMLTLLESVLGRQRARLAELEARLAGARGAARQWWLTRRIATYKTAIGANEERAQQIRDQRFDRFRTARARRLMTRENAVLDRLERRLRRIESKLGRAGGVARLERRRGTLDAAIAAQREVIADVAALLGEIAATRAGLPAAKPSWLVRLRDRIRQWLSRFRGPRNPGGGAAAPVFLLGLPGSWFATGAPTGVEPIGVLAGAAVLVLLLYQIWAHAPPVRALVAAARVGAVAAIAAMVLAFGPTDPAQVDPAGVQRAAVVQVQAHHAPRAIFGAEGDTPELVARALRMEYGAFVAFNAKHGILFADKDQAIKGKQVVAPGELVWWHPLHGDSLWSIYIDRLRNRDAYDKAYDASTDPQHWVDETTPVRLPDTPLQVPNPPKQVEPGHQPGHATESTPQPSPPATSPEARSPPSWLAALSWLGVAIAGLLPVVLFAPRVIRSLRAKKAGTMFVPARAQRDRWVWLGAVAATVVAGVAAASWPVPAVAAVAALVAVGATGAVPAMRRPGAARVASALVMAGLAVILAVQVPALVAGAWPALLIVVAAGARMVWALPRALAAWLRVTDLSSHRLVEWVQRWIASPAALLGGVVTAGLSGSIGALAPAVLSAGYVLASNVVVALGRKPWRWVRVAGVAAYLGVAWFGLSQLLPVIEAAAVAGGWAMAWTWVVRAGAVAGVVTAAVVGLRVRRNQAYLRQHTEWAATQPRLRRLKYAPKLPKDVARAVVAVVIGLVKPDDVADRLGVSTATVEGWRDRFLGAVPAVRMFRLVIGAWVGDGVVVDRPGFTRGQISKGRLVNAARHEEWLRELAAQLAKKRHRAAVLAMLLLLTEGRQPLLVMEEDTRGRWRFGPSPELRQLLARAPPMAVRALLRDPAKTLGVKDVAKLSPDELAELVFGFLRRVVWERDRVEVAPKPATPLAALTERLRAASAALAQHEAAPRRLAAIERMLAARAAGSWPRIAWAWLRMPRGPRSVSASELPGLRAAVRSFDRIRDELLAVQAAELRSALNRSAAEGYSKRKAENATRKASMSFAARNIATLLGLFTADPPESALMFTAADEQIGAHYGVSVGTINQVGPWLTAVSPVTGVLFAIGGDRLIATMRWIVGGAIVGVAGLVVAGFGAGSGLAGLIVTTLAMAVWDAAMYGPARARFDKYFPVMDQMRKAHRAAQLQSSFKLGQMLVRQVYLFAFLAVGVALSYLGMAVVAVLGLGVILVFLKRGSLKELPRPPPSLIASARGVLDQIRGTRAGLRRWLTAIPVGTLLTGLPMYVSGGAVALMLRMVIAYSGPEAWLVSGTIVTLGVTYLSFGPRVLAWGLGTPGIWTKLQKLLGSSRGGPGVDEARVLVGLSLLGAAMLLPAAFGLYLVPGFWELMMLMATGAVFTGWARTPHNGWTAGSSAATLIGASKGFAVMLGIVISVATVGATAIAATSAIDTGAAIEVVQAMVRSSLLTLSLVITGLMAVILAWSVGVRTYRIAPLSELNGALKAANPTRGPAILAALRDAGFGDVGLIVAVFLDHPPAGEGAAAAQQRRRDSVLIKDGDGIRPLDQAELDILRRALTSRFALGAVLRDAMLLAGLRAAGITTVRRAAAVFLDGRDAKLRAAVRVIDPITRELRPLTDEETAHIVEALSTQRDEPGTGSSTRSAQPAGTEQGPVLVGTGAELLAAIADLQQRQSWLNVSTANRIRWNATIHDLRIVADNLDTYQPGSQAHEQERAKAATGLAVLESLLAPTGPVGGLRKPHGSNLDERWLAPLATGRRLGPPCLIWAENLVEEHVGAPAVLAEQFDRMRGYVLEAIEILRGRPLHPTLAPLPVQFYMLDQSFHDPVTGQYADAAHMWVDGVLMIYAYDVVGAMHELAEAWFAVREGLAPEARHMFAVVFERAVSFYYRDLWITPRAFWELNWLGDHDPALYWDLVRDYPRVRAHIRRVFADRPEWREVLERYAHEFHHFALLNAPPMPIAGSAARGELAAAAREFEAIVDGVVADRAARRAARRRGADTQSKQVQMVRNAARVLYIEADLIGLTLSDEQLVFLAARFVHWGRAVGTDKAVRQAATDIFVPSCRTRSEFISCPATTPWLIVSVPTAAKCAVGASGALWRPRVGRTPFEHARFSRRRASSTPDSADSACGRCRAARG